MIDIQAEAKRIGLLGGAWRSIEREVIALVTRAVADEREECARLVCGYCDGHFPMWERKAVRGSSGSGNWVHQHKGDTQVTLCAATGIYNKIAFDEAVRTTNAKPTN